MLTEKTINASQKPSKDDSADSGKTVFERLVSSKLQSLPQMHTNTCVYHAYNPYNYIILSDDTLKAEHFYINFVFLHIYSLSVFVDSEVINNSILQEQTNTISCTQNQSSQILKEFSPINQRGPDQVEKFILKKCHKSLCKSLNTVFQTCFYKICVPTLEKKSKTANFQGRQ